MGFSHGLFRMILRVIPMFCFEILEKNRKSVKLKNLGIIGLLRRSVGNPRCGVDLRQGVGYPRCSEAEVPNGTPRVCQGVAKLCHCEGLCRNIAVLRRGIATVHSEQFLDCCSKSLVFVHR